MYYVVKSKQDPYYYVTEENGRVCVGSKAERLDMYDRKMADAWKRVANKYVPQWAPFVVVRVNE